MFRTKNPFCITQEIKVCEATYPNGFRWTLSKEKYFSDLDGVMGCFFPFEFKKKSFTLNSSSGMTLATNGLTLTEFPTDPPRAIEIGRYTVRLNDEWKNSKRSNPTEPQDEHRPLFEIARGEMARRFPQYASGYVQVTTCSHAQVVQFKQVSD